MSTFIQHKRQNTLILTLSASWCFRPISFDDYLWRSDASWLNAATNYGHLIQPMLSFEQLHLSHANGSSFTKAQFKGKWLLVVVSALPHSASCKTILYKIRQVRLALGKDTERIERLLITWP